MDVIPPLDESDYYNQLIALLPPGLAFDTAPGDFIDMLLHVIAAMAANADAAIVDFLAEIDPRTTTQLFERWETVFGLPDACVVAFDENQTLEQRRRALVAKDVATGGQSAEYFSRVAAALGYEISISNCANHSVGMSVSDPIRHESWNFAWIVNAQLNTVIQFDVKSGVGDTLVAWSNYLLECVIKRLSPAHTFVIFSYT